MVHPRLPIPPTGRVASRCTEFDERMVVRELLTEKHATPTFWLISTIRINSARGYVVFEAQKASIS